MTKRKILLTAFLIVALVQLYVPAKMIWQNEDVLASGTAYKFKTAPIDPSDPLRGKFIMLRYSENTVAVDNEQDWQLGEDLYVSLITNMDGFAKISSISKTKPTRNQDFVKAKVSFVSVNGSNRLTVQYPFDRYYMEETIAYDAEQAYRQSQLDTTKLTYALVKIKNGNAVLKDVLIGGTSIDEIVKADRKVNE